MTEIKYLYEFKPHGAIARTLLDEDIWVDIGNTDQCGVFDHHFGGEDRCALETAAKHPERFGNLLKYLERKKGDAPKVQFYTHFFPDLDAAMTIFSIRKMLDRGKTCLQDAFAPGVLDKLLDYDVCIDSGRKKIVTKLTLYALLQQDLLLETQKTAGDRNQNPASDEKTLGDREKSLIKLNRVFDVLERVVCALEKDPGIDLFQTPVNEYLGSQIPFYEEAVRSRIREQEQYEKERDNADVVIESVNLWNKKKGCFEGVRAAVWKAPSGCVDGYSFARELDQCLLTVVPLRPEDTSLSRVIIALNPDLPSSQEYTLRPLAELLEQCEQMEEAVYFSKNGRYRRDHSRPRGDAGHFSRMPFAETADPWFISEKEDLIDAPGAFSLIRYQQILDILKESSSVAKAAPLVRFGTDGTIRETGIALRSENPAEGKRADAAAVNPEKTGFDDITFGTLYEEVPKAIQNMQAEKDTDYLLSVVRVNPAMLQHGNTMLKACSLNMVGKSDTVMSDDNTLFLDYQNCLYSDQSITVLVSADNQEKTLGRLIGRSRSDSALRGILEKLLNHRRELREIGLSLSERVNSGQEESGDIREFNRRLVRLSAEMQSDELIVDPVEQEVYHFIKNCLGISELKESVMASAELLIRNVQQEHEEEIKKRDNNLQILISLFAFLGVFSALVDCFDYARHFMKDGTFRELTRTGQTVEILLSIVILAFAVFIAVKALRSRTDRRKRKDS